MGILEPKKEEGINEWRIGAVLVVLAIIIGGSLWILGNSSLAQDESKGSYFFPEKEIEEPEAEENQTMEEVEFEPPTTEEVPVSSVSSMSIIQVGSAWEIPPEYYLHRLVEDYQLEGNYAVDSKISELQAEGGFSNQRAWDLATEIESTKEELVGWEESK